MHLFTQPITRTNACVLSICPVTMNTLLVDCGGSDFSDFQRPFSYSSPFNGVQFIDHAAAPKTSRRINLFR